MKIVYHKAFERVYADDPAAEAGRMECILNELIGLYEFVEPQPAGIEDLLRVHTQKHIEFVKQNPLLYEVACLSAGGAILAAELAIRGEASFALIRPPGHHAGPDSCWGFCYFNNIAISVKKLLDEKKIEKALIVDFDLHYGDGTASIFKDLSEVTYYHLPGGNSRVRQLENLEAFLKKAGSYDILCVSAGFDRGKEDLGGILEIEDYRIIGQLLKEVSRKTCGGRRFAVLEGGYSHRVLGKNVKSFLEGFG